MAIDSTAGAGYGDDLHCRNIQVILYSQNWLARRCLMMLYADQRTVEAVLGHRETRNFLSALV